MDYYNQGYLEVRTSKNYAFVYCPLMDGSLSFKQKRDVYTDFKSLEIQLEIDGKREIIAYTSIQNPHIMVMFKKLEYEPFYLSSKKNVIWFKKEL